MTITSTDPRVRELAARIARLEDSVGKRGEQLAYSSIEDGALREFDLEGTQTAQYGQQWDGTSGAAVLVSPTPPAPFPPLVTPAVGGLRIKWNGTFADGIDVVAPMDFARVDIVVGPDGMDPIATPPITSINSPRGSEAFVALPAGDYRVALVTRTLAGTPSVATVSSNLYTPLEFVGGGGGAIVHLGASDPAAVAVDGDLWYKPVASGYETYIRDAGAWVRVTDTDIIAAAAAAAAAQSDADDAMAAAILAQTAADGAAVVYRQSTAPASGMATNDVWIDSDDGLLYVWTGAAWTLSADQRIAQVVSSNATKITLFAQTSAPSTSGRTTGDMWVDTDDGNRIYVWDGSAWTDRRDATIAAAAAAALAAQQTADAASVIYRQSAAPASGMATGDMWIDSDDGKVYIYTGAAWTLSDDQRIAAVVTSNASKITMFAQASMPGTTGRTLGDLWIDADDNNRLYVWEGSAWIDRRDASIAAAAALAQTAQNTAASKITVYRQSSAPTGTFVINDLWLDIDDGLVYYASTTAGGWTLHSDQRIGLVVTSNATKITVFAQISAPSTSGRTTGDLWIDTDDGNKIYDWSGSWTARTFGAAAISATARQLGAVTIYRQSTAPASGYIVNDLWVDSDDGLLYIATSTSVWTLSADQRVGTLVTSNATKVTAFPQTSAPSTSGRTIGDLWFDTDDGNKVYVWDGAWTLRQDAQIAAATSAANAATAAVASKVSVYRQSAAPVGTFVINDLWLDIDDGLVYYATTTAGGWTLHSDQRIGLVVTSNATKITMFAQISAPSTSGRTIGDMWIDTDDGNKIYDWSGSWTARLLGSTAISATARQLGAITVYRQSAAPASGMIASDLWIDSDDGKVYVYVGSTWTLSDDQRIALVVASDATKITMFAQISAPSTTGRTTGDMWIDTDDGNKIYDWTGAWTARPFGVSAISATARQLGATIVYRQSTAPASGMVAGDLWIDSDDGLLYNYVSSTWTLSADQRVGTLVTSNATKISLFSQASAPTTTGRTLGDMWIDTDDSNKIYDWNGSAWTLRLVGPGAVTTDVVDNKTITGSTLRTAASGERIEVVGGTGSTDNEIRFFPPTGTDKAILRSYVDILSNVYTRLLSTRADVSGLLIGGVQARSQSQLEVGATRARIRNVFGTNTQLDANSFEGTFAEINFDTGSVMNIAADRISFSFEKVGNAVPNQRIAGITLGDPVVGIEVTEGVYCTPMRGLEFKASDTTSGTTTSTTGVSMGTRGAEGTFVAPPSGQVLMVIISQIRASTAGQAAVVTYEMKTGATIGSGTSVIAVSIDRGVLNANSQNVKGSWIDLVTGLTPGATYNFRTIAMSGVGTSTTTYAHTRAYVIPQL